MGNITITMDDDTARWVRIEAAKAGKSVSRWVGDVLVERRRAQADAAWEAGREARRKAGEAFLATPLRPISDENGRLPTREELYDEVLRRHQRVGVREGQSPAFETDDREKLD
jgi:plasmid stability protein